MPHKRWQMEEPWLQELSQKFILQWPSTFNFLNNTIRWHWTEKISLKNNLIAS
jgi:hypothetical protein